VWVMEDPKGAGRTRGRGEREKGEKKKRKGGGVDSPWGEEMREEERREEGRWVVQVPGHSSGSMLWGRFDVGMVE